MKHIRECRCRQLFVLACKEWTKKFRWSAGTSRRFYVSATPWLWGDDVMASAASKLRAFHDATTDLVTEGQLWRTRTHDPVEVICHNDFAPYNLVFQDHCLVGAIDFDMASPGPRVWDLAYLAYRLVPLTAWSNHESLSSSAKERARRLALRCESYGLLTPRAVLDVAGARLDEIATFTRSRGGRAEHVELYVRDAQYVRANLLALIAG